MIHECGYEECDGIKRLVRDPYMADVYNRTVWVEMCEGQYIKACDEI